MLVYLGQWNNVTHLDAVMYITVLEDNNGLCVIIIILYVGIYVVITKDKFK